MAAMAYMMASGIAAAAAIMNGAIVVIVVKDVVSKGLLKATLDYVEGIKSADVVVVVV